MTNSADAEVLRFRVAGKSLHIRRRLSLALAALNLPVGAVFGIWADRDDLERT
jgi:hypothetical protein